MLAFEEHPFSLIHCRATTHHLLIPIPVEDAGLYDHIFSLAFFLGLERRWRDWTLRHHFGHIWSLVTGIHPTATAPWANQEG